MPPKRGPKREIISLRLSEQPKIVYTALAKELQVSETQVRRVADELRFPGRKQHKGRARGRYW